MPLTQASGNNTLDPGAVFERFLRIDTADGDASSETLRAYRLHVRQFREWWTGDLTDVMPDDIKEYRRVLLEQGAATSTIRLKLTAIRRLFASLIQAGICQRNPAVEVHAPRQRRSPEDVHFLTVDELQRIVEYGSAEDPVKAARDRAIYAICGIHGARGIEVQRADVSDLQDHDQQTTIRLRGKGHDRIIFLRSDVAFLVRVYLEMAGHRDGALFRATDRAHRGHRLSVRGVRQIVDGALRATNAKRRGVSTHALRHTAATLAYEHTHNLRAVQDMLGHADPKTTAIYAGIVDRAESNPAAAVPIKL